MTAHTIRRWLFLRGLSREQAHWGDFGQRCEEALGWNCSFIDLPGFGDQHALTSPLTIREIRQQLADRFCGDHTSPQGVVALSLGGMVALDWLAAEPQRFQAAVLINSSSRLSPWYQRLQLSELRRVADALVAKDPKHQERAILTMVSNCYRENSDEENDKVLAQWLDIRRKHPIGKANTLRQLFAASRFRPPATLPLSPLFITSYGDRMVSWKCSAELARRYGGQLIAHPTAGHDLPLDDPDWLIDCFRQRFT